LWTSDRGEVIALHKGATRDRAIVEPIQTQVKGIPAGHSMLDAGRAAFRHREAVAGRCPQRYIRPRHREPVMIVTIVTFSLASPTTLEEITTTFQATAPKYRGVPGLLRKNYWMSEDGRRAGGIYVWESRADADNLYTADWKAFVEGKYGTPPQIEYLHSPVMVDNRDGSIKVAA
jgi:hypothetical protein